MRFPSEEEISEIFKVLGLGNEEDRLKLDLERLNGLCAQSELLDEDYYTIQLSANTKIELAEDENVAELEKYS